MYKEKEIIDLRQRTGLNREQFAAALGVTHQTIFNWEKGISQPSYLATLQIDRLLNELEGIKELNDR